MTTSERLDAILKAMESESPRALSREALLEFPGLYRRLVSELAEARARGELAERLAPMEALVLRAHAALYVPKRERWTTTVIDLFRTFPRTARQSTRAAGLAAALLMVGAVGGYLEAMRDSASLAILLPGGLEANASESFQQGVSVRSGSPLYGVFYFTNNARVALMAYALGATAGVGTVLSLLFNGVVMGATFAVVQTLASPEAFVSFVVPHAGVELAAIVLAAAGGLRMAGGVIHPGWRRRRDGFVAEARASLPLAMGAAVLLAIAGLVEGWISPMPWPIGAKVAVGAGLDGWLVAYLVWGGRDDTT